MRLTDYCILFAALFVCLFLGRDLRIAGLTEQYTTRLVHEKKMDRIAEDALMDVVETQQDDGSPVIRMAHMQEKYAKLLRMQYDLTDEDCALRAWEAVTLWQFGQYPYAWSAQELDALRDELQHGMNEAKRRRREQTRLRLEFPYVAYEDWYQMPQGAQLFTGFDPRESFGGLDRAVFSASRIVKLKNSIVESREVW